jgi:hypothetical protein
MRDVHTRIEAYRLRDEGVAAPEIATRLHICERTVWRWLRDRPAIEAPLTRVRRLASELAESLKGIGA